MKLRNKLILSCAALAAVATTAFSTTFAWYTANDTVKASGITGKTSTQDATLLLISQTGRQGQWGASVTINSSLVQLDPVTYLTADKYVKASTYSATETYYTKNDSTYTAAEVEDADDFAAGTFYVKKLAGKYYQWDSAANCEGAEATGGLAASNQYISFYLYFKSGSAQSLDVNISKFNLRNTTTDSTTGVAGLPTFTVLATGTGSASSTYSVDMLKATNIVITQYNGVEGTDANPTIPASATAQQAIRTPYEADDAATYAGTIGDGANAHTYYNNVKSLTGSDAIDTNIVNSETSPASVSTLIPTSSNKYTFSLQTGEGATGEQDNILMVKFDIYLDGWDKLCFDACRKQTFALDMEFGGAPHTASNSNNG